MAWQYGCLESCYHASVFCEMTLRFLCFKKSYLLGAIHRLVNSAIALLSVWLLRWKFRHIEQISR